MYFCFYISVEGVGASLFELVALLLFGKPSGFPKPFLQKRKLPFSPFPCSNPLLSYKKFTPLSRVNFLWRKGWDLNPRGLAAYRFSRAALSTTQTPFHIVKS